MLELYQLEECPHCRKVRQQMSDWEIDYLTRNVPSDLTKRTQLMKVSGQVNVPTLVDSDREVTVVGDAQEILDYLEKFHKPPAQIDRRSCPGDAAKEPPPSKNKGYA